MKTLTLSSTRRLALPLLLSLAAGAAQSMTMIDFESLPLNTTVSNQYGALGVTFSSPANPTQPQIEDFSGNSTTGKLLADFSVVGGIRLDAQFTTPVTEVSAIAYANPSYKVTMRAYDAADNLLGTAIAGLAAFNKGTIGLSGVGLIAKVTWDTASDSAAVGIDDLMFTPAVPEPGTWALLLAGLLALPRLARRSRPALD